MIPSDETIDWIFDASHWWLQAFGGFETLTHGSIVTPSEDDFPVDSNLTGHALAEDYFAFAMEHAGMNDWPFQLECDDTPNVADALQGMPHGMTSAPTSTDEAAPIEDGEPLSIPYSASQLEDPVDLVATMARGMSHYHLFDAPTPFPGEPENREYFVDLGAAFLGFGIFMGNSAFQFEQTEAGMMVGWGFSRRGALSQLDVSYVLALVATLLETPDSDVVPHLTANARAFFKSGKKHISRKRRDDLERLRQIPSTANGPYR